MRVFQPPSDFGPGTLFVRERVPPDTASWLRLLAHFCLPLVIAGAIAKQVGPWVALPGLVVLGLISFPPGLRVLREVRDDYLAPDAVGLDERGVIARSAGRATFRVPWSRVRRLDAGAGREAGWLRLWVIDDAIEGVDRLPRRRHTSEGAALLARFGPGMDREALLVAVERHAPEGIRVRL
ncbi:hypothetical protein OYE22_23515 [Streptomyces sp. 71268]|uniref:hypothetical protein n=1 Tax=Streptomyces sp. 71268 TaxID=3002640 RepID=UPI0023F6B963|nr:hypothetical protein [Streptomyces sp. 71268]WEV27816.1 hypothetical protein OYE22_23515 [Streptomyces sp. 71268]